MRLAWVAVLGVACLARAESLSLSVASGTRCVTESSLRQQLTRAGLVVADSGELDVDVSSSPDGAVRLRARRGRDARLLVRTLPVRSTCDGLELALVTLIREWATATALVTLDAGRLPSRNEGLDARSTRSDAGVTRSDSATTRSEPAMTRSEPAMTRSGSAMTRSDAGVTRSEFAMTRSDAGTARSESAVAGDDADGTRSEATSLRSDAGAARTELAAARSDADVTRSEATSPRNDAGTTRTELAAARSDADVTRTDSTSPRSDASAAGVMRGDATRMEVGAEGRATMGADAGETRGESASSGSGAAVTGASDRDGARSSDPTPSADPVSARGAPAEPGVAWEVRFALAGGVTALIDAPVSPSGSALLDIGSSTLGAALEGTFDANVTLTAGGGTLTFNSQSVTLGARWRFSWERLSVDLGLGARGFRISATPAGFTTNTPVTLFSLGPAVTTTVWVRLAGPLQLVVRGVVALRLPADQLNILNGPTFRLGPWQAGAVAGLALAWP